MLNFDEATANRIFTAAPDDSGFGLRYQFSLFDDDNDHAINAPEWLVPAPLLARVAKECGFVVERRVGFREFAVECLTQGPTSASWSQLYRDIFVPNCKDSMTPFEWDLVGLYQVIFMRKVSPSSSTAASAAGAVVNDNEDDYAMRYLEMTAVLAARMGSSWDNLSSDKKTEMVEKLLGGS